MSLADASVAIVLILAGATLLFIAINDLRHYTIRNAHIGILAGLFVAYALISGRWTTAYWNVALALLMFVVLLFVYTRGGLGGGDVKILTVAFLWTGPTCALLFSIVMAVSALIHAGLGACGVGGFVKDGRKRLAFGPSVAIGMIAVFVSGCLYPVR